MSQRYRQIIFFISIIAVFSFVSPSQTNAKNNEIAPHVHILIDPGHGGIDGGAAYDQVEEKNVNLSMSLKLYEQLSRRGYHVTLTRDKDEALSDTSPRQEIRSRHRRDLVQRGEIANYLHPQIMISLHVNSGSSNGTGSMVLYQKNGQSFMLANILQEKLNLLSGKRTQPILRTNLFLLNQPHAISVIVEMGFISNPEERALLIQPVYQQMLMSSIAEAIDEYMIVFPWYLSREY